MATANEEYRDAVLRHAIGLRRYSSNLLARVIKLLTKADTDLSVMLRSRLADFPEGGRIDYTGERWKAMLADIQAARDTALQQYKDLLRGDLSQLSVDEARHEVAVLEASIPIEVALAQVTASQLRAIVSTQPFQGHLLKDWFRGLEQADKARLRQAIQLGMAQGEPIDNIVRRIVGTKANAFADGILSITRRDAVSIARTAVNHVSNAARSYVWDDNSDVIQCRIWHSTLDGRTSAVCRARDGLAAPVGDNELPPGLQALVPANATPPAHVNCRSVMVAYIDGVGLLGNRPFVRDTRTPDGREIDFRAQAKEEGRDIADVRSDWAAKNIGRVPASTNYQEFLSRQSPDFQDEVLGKTKGKLFRDGGLKLTQFVDRAGNELTLDDLRATLPDAFDAAGV